MALAQKVDDKLPGALSELGEKLDLLSAVTPPQMNEQAKAVLGKGEQMLEAATRVIEKMGGSDKLLKLGVADQKDVVNMVKEVSKFTALIDRVAKIASGGK